MEVNLTYLRPEQIRQRLAAVPVVFIPLGPLEWHGPHMPYGTDPINAQHVAAEVCRRLGGVVWPTLFWGTERERPEAQLRNLGFAPDEYVVGMDFPKNSLPSFYCPEEILALIMRETLRQARAVLGAKLAVIVNGHGAENHMAALRRLAVEFSNTTDMQVYFRLVFPRADIAARSCDHASAGETSLMMHMTQCVDLATLPPRPQRLKYTDYAIVDGPGFDGLGPPDKCLDDKVDPRVSASPERGRKMAGQVVGELDEEVRQILQTMGLGHQK